MGLRIAEIGKYAVAHVSGDETAGIGNLFSTAAVVRADDLAHVLRVQAGGECGRAYEVAEHDRKLTPLGLGPPLLLRRNEGTGKFSNRRQHNASMAERDAKLFQIPIRQMMQDGNVDIVLDKALGILGQTERGQPLRDRGHLLSLAVAPERDTTTMQGNDNDT